MFGFQAGTSRRTKTPQSLDVFIESVLGERLAMLDHVLDDGFIGDRYRDVARQ